MLYWGCLALKNKRRVHCKTDINQMRAELHQLIESEQLNSKIVQERSQELDTLILLFYRQAKECHALKEP